jgi:hypothetical protein
MTTLTGSVLSGTDFKKTFSGPFYKFLYNDFTHNNFTYNVGLNIDIKEFNPTGECQKGGLYFCEVDKCFIYYSSYGSYLAQIDVPADAKVYIEQDKFKADRLIICSITHFDNVSSDFWIGLLKYDGLALRFIKEQTEELCKLAIHQNSEALRYVKKQTYEICELAGCFAIS